MIWIQRTSTTLSKPSHGFDLSRQIPIQWLISIAIWHPLDLFCVVRFPSNGQPFSSTSDRTTQRIRVARHRASPERAKSRPSAQGSVDQSENRREVCTRNRRAKITGSGKVRMRDGSLAVQWRCAGPTPLMSQVKSPSGGTANHQGMPPLTPPARTPELGGPRQTTAFASLLSHR
jgi:hypothetical protein